MCIFKKTNTMKQIYYLIFALLLSNSASSQICNVTVYPHVVSQGVGSFHILSDTTMPFNDGSDFYVCAGVHLTMAGSAGSNYMLEAGAQLTLLDHDGDNVFAKPNCIITDYSTTTLVVTSEGTVTISKPNDAFNYVSLTCPSMFYDYQLVGGSSPCNLGIHESNKESLNMFPNPLESTGVLNFGVKLEQIEIYDLTGRLLIKDSDLNSTSISLDGLNKGVFFIRAISDNGQLYTEQLIIE